MTHEKAALFRLNTTVAGGLTAIATAARGVNEAELAWVEATGLVPGLQAALTMILACEALEAAAKASAAACRTALAEAMATGATTVRTEHHTASLRAAPMRVLVTDAALLPPHLMRQPPPAPDLTAIGTLLRDGQDVPGAVLGNGGPDTVQIRTRKETP